MYAFKRYTGADRAGPVAYARKDKRTMSTATPIKIRSDVSYRLSRQERQAYERIPFLVDYVPDASFSRPETEAELYGDQVERIDVPAWTHFPEVPEDMEGVRTGRVKLNGHQEAVLFLRYNYARYRLSHLVDAQRRGGSLPRAREMLTWYGWAMDARAALVRANMALVLAMAKRTRIPNVEFSELISEGNMALLRAVEKFDVARGYKFSTYACRAILKGFNRLATKTGRYRQHFPKEFEPELERSDYDQKRHEMQREYSVDAVREILVKNRARLSEVERTIVLERFAIASRTKAKTLAEVGKMVGLTNERVRQIQNHALSKIRAALDEDYLVA
jgi:RNA polymerase sigma factor (sigma-70 family)